MLRTKSGQNTIRTIPAKRIFLETDAPFTMKISSVNALKAELKKLVNSISEIRNEDVRKIVENNSSILLL